MIIHKSVDDADSPYSSPYRMVALNSSTKSYVLCGVGVNDPLLRMKLHANCNTSDLKSIALIL